MALIADFVIDAVGTAIVEFFTDKVAGRRPWWVQMFVAIGCIAVLVSLAFLIFVVISSASG